MSKETISENVYEQYIDAANALIMEQYALALRERVQAEENEAEAVEIPAELDKKCRKLIRKKLAKERGKHIAKRALHFSGVAAALVITLFGIGGILFTTVEAVRVPIINFFIEQRDGYVEINGTEPNGAGGFEEDVNFLNTGNPLEGLLPEGYALKLYDLSSAGNVTAYYENAQGDSITFDVCKSKDIILVDTENAVQEQRKLGPYDALLVEKHGYQLVWLNTDTSQLFHLCVTALSREETLTLAENILKLS